MTAVLLAHLPGSESGSSLVDILFGDVSPSGRLPYTIGRRIEDYGTEILFEPNGPIPQQDFEEGLYIDYRWFDKHDLSPRFEFGAGLVSPYLTDYSPIQILTYIFANWL